MAVLKRIYIYLFCKFLEAEPLFIKRRAFNQVINRQNNLSEKKKCECDAKNNLFAMTQAQVVYIISRVGIAFL